MKDEGGTAFPVALKVIGNEIATEFQPGLSVRDYFAAQALAGFLGSGVAEQIGPRQIALESYIYADAMIAERNKE